MNANQVAQLRRLLTDAFEMLKKAPFPSVGSIEEAALVTQRFTEVLQKLGEAYRLLPSDDGDTASAADEISIIADTNDPQAGV